MADDHEYGLVFLDASQSYAYGVEFGMLFMRMKQEDKIADWFTVANQEQITLLANRTGWVVEKMDVENGEYEGWFYVEMHKE